MKKITIIIALLACAFASQSQNINANRVIVHDSIWLNGKWVKSFSDDTTMGNGAGNVVPTQKAVKGAIGYAIDSLSDSLGTVYNPKGIVDDTIPVKNMYLRISPGEAQSGLRKFGVGDVVSDWLTVRRDRFYVTSSINYSGELWRDSLMSVVNVGTSKIDLYSGGTKFYGGGSAGIRIDTNLIRIGFDYSNGIDKHNILMLIDGRYKMKFVPDSNDLTANWIVGQNSQRFLVDATPKVASMISDSLSGTGSIGNYLQKDDFEDSLGNYRVNGYALSGNVTLDKSDVGLGNVDNTSDADKSISTATQAALDGKVDKIAGKELSDENYTTAEKVKLSGVATGAEVNINADWSAGGGDAKILNKPTKLSDFDNDEGFLGSGYIYDHYRGRDATFVPMPSTTPTTVGIVLLFRDKVVLMNYSSNKSFFISTNADTPLPIGFTTTIVQMGSGYIKIEVNPGVTLHSATGNYETRTQFSVCQLLKTGPDTWLLFGDIK